MRSTAFPDFPDTDEGDVAADEFYNKRTASGDCRNGYECFEGVDRLLKARGLELLMYEGSSDHVFEIVEYQEPAAPKPMKRFRGPEIVDVLADAGIDPALAEIIDPKPEPLDLADAKAAQAKAADLMGGMIPSEEPKLVGVEKLDMEEVLSLLQDPSITGDERKALHAQLDKLVG